MAGLSALLLVAMVVQSFAAVCEAVQIAPLTGERITVRYLSAAVVRGVDFVARRRDEKPQPESARVEASLRPLARAHAGVRVGAVGRVDHHLTHLLLSLPPPALM